MNSIISLGLLAIVFSSFNIHAQATRRLSIQSQFDRFDLILKSNNTGTVNGKKADLRALNDLWPVLNNPLGNECPTLGKPDITVKENGKQRSIYVKQGIVSDGKACLNVGGEGLFYFPIHRDFLIGPKSDSIKLSSPLKIFRQGVKLVDLHKQDDEWMPEKPETLLNWDFLDRFENSLRDFDIRLRVHKDIAKDKSKMIVQSGNQSLEFYKVTSVMWAVKKPGAHWLIASDDWSFWYDFDLALVEDRYASEIRLLKNTSTPREERAAAMERLEGLWSRNLRDLYHTILSKSDEDPAFQETALSRLRRKPSPATSKALARFIEDTTNPDLKRMATEILKVHTPKSKTKTGK